MGDQAHRREAVPCDQGHLRDGVLPDGAADVAALDFPRVQLAAGGVAPLPARPVHRALARPVPCLHEAHVHGHAGRSLHNDDRAAQTVAEESDGEE